MDQDKTPTKIITTVVAIIIVIGVVVLIEYLQNKPSAVPVPVTSGAVTPPASTSSTSSSTTYKDGTYTAKSEYYVPHGAEDIQVTMAIANNTVTSVSIDNSEGNPESAQYQEEFANDYKSYVVGKKVNDIHLSYIAGASDTTDGFNNALDQIRTKAQA